MWSRHAICQGAGVDATQSLHVAVAHHLPVLNHGSVGLLGSGELHKCDAVGAATLLDNEHTARTRVQNRQPKSERQWKASAWRLGREYAAAKRDRRQVPRIMMWVSPVGGQGRDAERGVGEPLHNVLVLNREGQAAQLEDG